MLENLELNKEAILKIALALGELNEKVVFVGGAVVGLYVDDPCAVDTRPTKDVDITLEITGMYDLETLRENLIKKGFRQSHEDDVICRFRYEETKVDVMSTQQVGWAPANYWFAAGFEKAKGIIIDNTKIKLLPLPYFLATKFSAHYDRGGIDPRTSHDFEDIVYILNFTSFLKNSIFEAENEVQNYLKEAFQKILEDDRLFEALRAHIGHEEYEKRLNRMINDLNEIISGT